MRQTSSVIAGGRAQEFVLGHSTLAEDSDLSWQAVGAAVSDIRGIQQVVGDCPSDKRVSSILAPHMASGNNSSFFFFFVFLSQQIILAHDGVKPTSSTTYADLPRLTFAVFGAALQ